MISKTQDEIISILTDMIKVSTNIQFCHMRSWIYYLIYFEASIFLYEKSNQDKYGQRQI